MHYSSYFEGLFISEKIASRGRSIISVFFFFSTFLKWMNKGSSLLCQIFLHLSTVFFKINYFFSREKTKRYFSRLFPDWAVRLQKITENRYQLSILQKVKFPQPKYLFCKTRKFDLLFYFLRFFKGLPSWGYYGDNIFFYEVQHFVVKQRIRNCLWKRASRSLFENGMPLASFKYALKKRFFLST